jgi:Ca2+-binding EF-hand superfamily protein
MEWVSAVLIKVTPYDRLDLDEFVTFIEEYEQLEANWAKTLFTEYDADSSGTLDMEEITILFDNLGFTPMTHVILDIIREVDPANVDELTFEEFWEVMLHLRINEGFTKAEVRHFEILFAKFDTDGSGDLETKELSRILTYLGYVIDPAVVKKIVEEVDVDGNGELDSHEFRVCMRKIREYEVAQIRKLFAQFDEDGSGGIEEEELLQILRSLGYFPERDEIHDTFSDIGANADSELNFDQLWRFLEVYRKREGFSKADMADIEDAFNEIDSDGSGQLEVHELGRMFAILGCIVTHNQAQRFVAYVDIDGSGTLDLREFTKVVRQVSQTALQKAKAAFEKEPAANLDVIQALVPFAHAKDTDKVIYRLGSMEQAYGELDQFNFVSAINSLRKKTSRHIRRNHGFGHLELAQLKKQFETYDADNKGFLYDKEVQRLLEDRYPGLSEDTLFRPLVLEIMKSAPKDFVDFKAFLQLVRRCTDLSFKEKVSREKEAVKQTGFTSNEVKEFRELFLGSTDRETLALPQFMEMIAPLVPLGHKHSMEITEMFMEVVGKDKEAEFADFLVLFRRILESDLGNINEHAQDVVNNDKKIDSSRRCSTLIS